MRVWGVKNEAAGWDEAIDIRHGDIYLAEKWTHVEMEESLLRKDLGLILTSLLLIWAYAAGAANPEGEGECRKVTILYSHFMAGHLEPCG